MHKLSKVTSQGKSIYTDGSTKLNVRQNHAGRFPPQVSCPVKHVSKGSLNPAVPEVYICSRCQGLLPVSSLTEACDWWTWSERGSLSCRWRQ